MTDPFALIAVRQQAMSRPRYEVRYLGAAFAVIDRKHDNPAPVGNRDYASARSAQRAADRLNAQEAQL